MMATTFTCWSQVTIELDDFPRQAGFLDTIIRANPANVFAPSEGADQTWDYSALGQAALLTNQWFDAAGDLDFPNALNYEEEDLSFQGFIIPGLSFEALDNDGWYEPGRYLSDVIYPISAITGGPNDSLRFVGGKVEYGERINTIQFPMNYGDEWEGNRTEIVNYELTVAAFGLNKTPGQRKRFGYEHRKVVGYGQLTIPDFDGSAGAPMEVLLLKVNRSNVDSIYLGGAPAPQALMAAFGLTQGSMAADSFYVFYRPAFGAPALNVNLPDNSGGLTAFYRPQSLSLFSAVKEPSLTAYQCFPNPIAGGETLTLQSETPVNAGHFRLMNLMGQVVFSTDIKPELSNQIQVKMPNQMMAGLCLYQVLDANGTLLGAGKLQVQ